MAAFIDRTGQRYGKLVVLLCFCRRPGSRVKWLCQDDSGEMRVIDASDLHRYKGVSERSRLRTVWRSMLYRCNNPKSSAWLAYGGRRIKVCERWTEFENFFADVSPCPTGAELDRRDNDGDYSPTNCRWASTAEQARNRRSNLLLCIGGETMPMATAAERFGTSISLVWSRLKRGWPDELAVLGPKLGVRGHHGAALQ